MMEEMMDASNNHRFIPLHIVAEILVNLPIKHLLRFSSVSKSWRSLIFHQSFMKKRAAAVGEQRRLVMSVTYRYDHPRTVLAKASSYFLSSNISYDEVVEDIVCPIEGTPTLSALCGELLCVKADYKSLYLWNPSIRSYKKIPDPSYFSDYYYYIYGLGYDSVSDDFKIFALETNGRSKCKLYSLRAGSWREIEEMFPVPLESVELIRVEDMFVSGAFHWMVTNSKSIISFDLGTEKFGSVAPPPDYRIVGEELPLERKKLWSSPLERKKLWVGTLNGKLCVFGKLRPTWICIECRSYYSRRCNRCLNSIRFVVWVMEEYGIEKSWTKIFDINCGDQFPPDVPLPRLDILYWMGTFSMKPLYLFDNGEILFITKGSRLCVYKGEEAMPWKSISGKISNAFVYDEGYLSPAIWAASATEGDSFQI